MTGYTPAKKITTPYSFGEGARWIHQKGAEKMEHDWYRRTFSLGSVPSFAVVLAMAANYAEIYFNGHFIAGLSERSYIFDKAYEVYDVTPYLREGENVIAVMAIATGEEIRDGFALELLADGESVLVSDETWRVRRDEARTPCDYYLWGEPEIVDGEKCDETVKTAACDDHKWELAGVIGDELLHAPYERFHQHFTRAQTAETHFPCALSELCETKPAQGYAWRFVGLGSGVTCVMTSLFAPCSTSVHFVTYGSFRGIALDGTPVSLYEDILVEAGTHTLALAFSWTQELWLRTDGKLCFSGVEGAPFAALLLPTPPVKYPWNDYRDERALDARVRELLAATTLSAWGTDATPFTPNAAQNALSSILFRDIFIPRDGFADEKILQTEHPTQTDEMLGVQDQEALFCADGETVIPEGKTVQMILDFGEEQIGHVCFSVDAPAGTWIEIHAFELIADAGIQYRMDRSTIRYRTREGVQAFRSCKRLGFRYLLVSISGHTRPVSLREISVLETRYPVEKADFSCSDAMLNRIFKMSARTAEVCMLDMYVDCPGHEQNPWTGDARVTANINLAAMGAYDFDAEYLKTIASSIDDGLFHVYRRGNPRYRDRLYLTCACFPTYPDGCIPIWSFQWLLQIYDHYMATGDLALLAELFPAVKETLSRCEAMLDDRDLFDMLGAWNLIEWANNDLTFYGEVTANNIMLAYCLEAAAEMAMLLGENGVSAHYTTLAERICAAVNRYAWDEAKEAYVDTVRDEYAYHRHLAYMEARGMEKMPYAQFLSMNRISVQTNTFAILYGAAPEERRVKAARFLIDNMETGAYVAGTPANRTFGMPEEAEAPDGYVHIGSPFFLYFALDALYVLGLDELALRAQKRDFGDMLASGLTTCIEKFKKGREWTRSVAHAWSASPAFYFVREVLGVKPAKPGYREFTVTPHSAFLTSARGSVPTPYGRITVSWVKNEDGTLTVLCDAPTECRRVDPAET